MNEVELTIALAGNPNSGKTTLFNAVTGSHRHVGNYPGVTVQESRGRREHRGASLRVVDLPGAYSLTAYSLDEAVARRFVLDERPDVVVDVIDSSNLQRNLYLATQLLEADVPLVLAFNMADLAAERGCAIDVPTLAGLLGAPIVQTVAHKGKGIDELLDAALEAARRPQEALARQHHPDYGQEIEPHVRQLAELIAARRGTARQARWLAVKLLEGDGEAVDRLARACPDHVEEFRSQAARLRGHIEKVCGNKAEIVLAGRRYGFIAGACAEAVTHRMEGHLTRSDRIDVVLTHPYLGLPILALMMYLAFQLTFWVGNPIVDFLQVWKERLAGLVRGYGAAPGAAPGIVQSLVADGLIDGVGAVLVFVPLILLLFAAIAVLEDSGYMARAAFLLDKLMHRIGLQGKSFIPMLVGFGCTVPGIMATRTLESRRDRLTTMMILPLMSCGARLPVYILILGAFFRKRTVLGLHLLGFPVFEVTNQALLLFAIYVIGIVLAVAAAKVLRSTVFRGETTPFVMELPPYRLPTLKGMLVHVAEPTWMYARKAGTIILAIVISLWALKAWPALPPSVQQPFDQRRALLQAEIENPRQAFDARLEPVEDRLQQLVLAEHQAQLQHSAVGRIGKALAPVLAPCGFDWKVATALVGAFAAKEVFVGQMGVMYAVGEHIPGSSETLQEKLAADYTPLQGFCMMLFILIASPCMATVAATVRESGSWKWALLQWGWLTGLAWMATTTVFQAGKALGL